MGSLLIYICGFTISIYLIYIAEKIEKTKDKTTSKKILIIISLLIPITIAGLRYNVGTDYKNYIALYNKYASIGIRDIFKVSEVEPFFIIICKIAYMMNDVNIIFFAYSALTVGFTFAAIWNNRDKTSVSLTFLLYLYLYFRKFNEYYETGLSCSNCDVFI